MVTNNLKVSNPLTMQVPNSLTMGLDVLNDFNIINKTNVFGLGKLVEGQREKLAAHPQNSLKPQEASDRVVPSLPCSSF